ncbi:endonuclease/exonuclease/phosphatase family protein [Halobacillus campisalis]|uniref:Endonuclease/exonuclease/phosphatase family protein n=1 Tax=Halobacillus campisalis TaxID=435909 RepID=A0ABW2JY80_9BACI|nr:endonuclease/exonuclease/phosphatase family protein [Halobacillus campisalis]
MRLLTLNVHAWQEEKQLDKILGLAEVIHEKRYDVIALQEVNQHQDSPLVYKDIKQDNYGLVLLEKLKHLGSDDYELHWDISHIGYEVYEEGIALLTRHPVDQVHKFYITSSNRIEFWKSRKIVGATLTIDGSSLSFYSCHLGWWGDADEPYERQINQLVQTVSSPAFLMGDFNAADSQRNEGYDYLKSKGFMDAHETAHKTFGSCTIEGKIAGWDKNSSDLKIDHIFTNDQVDVSQSSVIFNGKYEPVVSDHYGLEIECYKK